MDDRRNNRVTVNSSEEEWARQRRRAAKALVDSATRLLQDAQDELIIAKAAAESDVDPVFVRAQEHWRFASSNYSNALNEYTRLLGPKYLP